jgi:hypothetical protein
VSEAAVSAMALQVEREALLNLKSTSNNDCFLDEIGDYC